VKHIADAKATGRRIRELRAERGLSQRELAFRGCSYAYISRIEAGERTPSTQVLREIASRLGTTERYLATGQREPLEIGLESIGLTLGDLTTAERQRLDEALDTAAAEVARNIGRKIVRDRRSRGRHAQPM
jgi:transcriptional regulator with XRE-family HTH domain